MICALGTPSPLLERGTRNLVTAMSELGVPRLVCVTLLGTGASRANAALLYRTLILRMLATMVPDKEAQEQVVRASDLDWVLVRRPRFAASRPRGSLGVIAEGEPGRTSLPARQRCRTAASSGSSSARWMSYSVFTTQDSVEFNPARITRLDRVSRKGPLGS